MNLTRQKSLPIDGAAATSETLQDLELLHCMICFEPFREPKMLNCAHTFCSKCLEEYYSCYFNQKRAISGHIPCPNCRELTPWPANGSAGLRTDFKVQQIEDLLKTMSTQVLNTSSLNSCCSCAAQGKKIQAKSYCFSCEKSYCRSCTLKHSQNALFTSHRVVTVPSASSGHATGEKCPHHPEEDRRYLCRTCHTFACTLCLMNGHTKHEAVELKLAVREQLDNLKAFMSSIDVKKDGFRKSLGELEPLVVACNNACSDVEKAVSSRAAKMISDVKRQEADLLGQIRAVKEKKLSVLEKEVRRIRKTLDNLEKIEKLTASTPSTLSESFESNETLMQRMSTILEVDTRQQDLRNLVSNAVLLGFDPSQDNNSSSNNSNILGQLFETRAKPQSAPANSAKQNGNRSSLYGGDGKVLPAAKEGRSSSFTGRKNKSPMVSGAKLLLEISRHGSQAGELNQPLWVTRLRNSKIVVSEWDNKRLQMFDKSGRSCEMIGHQSMHPAGIAVTSKGNLIVADAWQKCIEVFSPEGKKMHRWGNGKFFSPHGVAVCPNGNIVVSDVGNDTISVFRNESNCVFVLGLSTAPEHRFDGPCYVAAGPHNEIIVSDAGNHRVKIFDSQGKFVASVGSRGSGEGEFERPCGVCSDHEGNIFVADSGNDRVSLVTRSGVFSGHVLTREHGLQSPKGLFLDSDGKLIVTESSPTRSAVKIFELPG